MTKYVPYIVIAVLLVSLLVSLTNRKEVVIEKITSDTVYSVKLDTYKVKTPIFITERIVDTIYIKSDENGDILLPITQKYYKDSLYEAWVSGFKPSLDSINVYNKTKFVTITNTITKEIYPKKTDFYIDGGVLYMEDKFAPNIGATVKFRNDMTLRGGIGYYDRDLYYMFNVGIKLNK